MAQTDLADYCHDVEVDQDVRERLDGIEDTINRRKDARSDADEEITNLLAVRGNIVSNHCLDLPERYTGQ